MLLCVTPLIYHFMHVTQQVYMAWPHLAIKMKYGRLTRALSAINEGSNVHKSVGEGEESNFQPTLQFSKEWVQRC